MAFSGSFDYSRNRDEIIKDAFVEAGVLRPDETPESLENVYAAHSLQRMLKAWLAMELQLWLMTKVTLFMEKNKNLYLLGPSGNNATKSFVETAVRVAGVATDTVLEVTSTTNITALDYIGVELDTGAMHWTTVDSVTDVDTLVLSVALPSAAAAGKVVYAYTNKIQRPLKLVNAVYFVHGSSNYERRMYRVSRREYWELTQKDTLSPPSQYWFDPQLTNAELNVYGVPENSVDRLELILQMPTDDVDVAADDLLYPQEWYEAIVYNLAYRLAIHYRATQDDLTQLKIMADKTLKLVKSFDEERADIRVVPGPWLRG